MIFTKELRIDIAQIGVNETIHLHEGDVNGTEFYISLYKNGEPLSLALYNVKYDASIDGYLAEQDANVSLIQGNEIHVPITERMTAKNGILRIDIKLMKNHDVAFIQTIEAFVQRRVINDKVVIDVSGTTIGAKLQELDTKITQALESLDDKVVIDASGTTIGAKLQELDIKITQALESLDGKADISGIPTKVSDLDNDAHYLTSHQDISGKEDKSNKRQTINPAEAQNIGAIYPSVKAVVDYVANNHQDISGKVDKTQTIAGLALSGNIGGATLAEAMAGNINPVGVVPGTTTGYGAQFGRSSAGKPVMHMLSKDWEELALASDVSGKQDKQTSVPTVGITEERGQWVVDTTDSVFRGLSIGQLFKAEIGEVYHTYQKTSESTYLKISDILHDGDIPSNVSAFNNDAGYLTTHQDISGKADKATTLAGYGITNAYTKTEVDTALSAKADSEDVPANLNDLLDGNTAIRRYAGNSAPPTGDVAASSVVNIPCIWYYSDDAWLIYSKHSGTQTGHYQYDTILLTKDTHQDISGKEDKSNKVTLISNSSTDTQYPSALAVKNYVDTVIGGIENGSY